MSRLTSGIVLAASLTTLLWADRAHAGQAEIAAQLNDEGKNLMFEKKYAEASAKFADAVARVPEAKYFFNLCMSRYQEGKFGEALTACNSVEKNGADDSLKTKASKLTDKIKDEAKQQGLDLQPAGGGAAPGDTPPVVGVDPNGGGAPPTGGGTPPPTGGVTGAPPTGAAFAVGRPPQQGLYAAAAPEHHYTWTLGFDVFGGGGKIGGTDPATGQNIYGSAAGGFRVKSDYMIDPARKLGGEGYIQVTHFGANQMQQASAIGVDTLDLVDLGVAGYKHLCQFGGRMCLTPLIGVHLSLMAPGSAQYDASSEVANYASFGVRAEVSGSIAFGPRFEHVLSAMVGVNGYTAAFASPSDPTVGPPASEIGLDQGGAYAYIGLGYSYRFNTPLGHAAFVTLE